MAAEAVQEQGRKYAFFVAGFVESIYNVKGEPVWKLVADAYNNAPMTTLRGENGKVARMDLYFSECRTEIDKPRLSLYIEAKGSYDQDYINAGFRDFLEKLVGLGRAELLGEEGRRKFMFAAPVLPQGCHNPRSLAEMPGVLKLIQELGISKGEDMTGVAEALAPRLVVLQLPLEHSAVFGGLR